MAKKTKKTDFCTDFDKEWSKFYTFVQRIKT